MQSIQLSKLIYLFIFLTRIGLLFCNTKTFKLVSVTEVSKNLLGHYIQREEVETDKKCGKEEKDNIEIRTGICQCSAGAAQMLRQ